MSEIEERFKRVENQIEWLSSNSIGTSIGRGEPNYSSSYGVSDEVELLELAKFIWGKKLYIAVFILVFAAAGILYALYLPNIYRASTQLVLAEDDAGSFGGMASQYGGLAAMAGINIGGDSSKLDQALALGESWPFINDFVSKYDLKPAVFAVDYWDEKTGRVVFDSEKYDATEKTWKTKNGKSLEPTDWDVYEVLSEMVYIHFNDKTGIFEISVQHQSPILATQWVTWFAREINLYFQQRDMRDARQNIAYLKAEVGKTNVTLLQERLYGLIETQMQALMLSEVRDEYLLKTLVPALEPQKKVAPKRSIIVIIFIFLGAFLSILFVAVLNLRNRLTSK